MTEIEKYTDEDVKKVLIVNKSDLEDKTEVTPEDLEWFSKEHGIPYMYTSAKNGYNVDKAFMKMTQELIKVRE